MASARLSLLIAGLSFVCATAHAQFVGDVFAKVPSLAAPAGGTATVEVQLFSGAVVFGASIVDLTFQAGELAVREVLLSGVAGQRRIAVDRKTSGKVEIATFSVETAALPIGTLTLAEVVFDVLAAPGTVARYTMTPREIITQREGPYARRGGAVGEVVVVTQMSAGTAGVSGASGTAGASKAVVSAQDSTAAAPPIVSDRASLERAAALRPRGGVVDLVVPVQRGLQVSPVTVRVQPKPALASE